MSNWVKAKRASDEAFMAKARATLRTDAYHKAEGRTNRDIAAMLGIHVDSYSMRLTRARRLLARQGVAA